MSDARVTMSDIARMVGLSLPAVSNWRRRHSSFPGPDENDTFSVALVAEWLDNRKISKKDLGPGELPGTTYGARFRQASGISKPTQKVAAELWVEVNAFRGAEDGAVFADLVLGLVYLAATDPQRWREIISAPSLERRYLVERAAWQHEQELSDLLRAVRSVFRNEAGVDRLARLVDFIDRISSSGRHAEIFEFLLNWFAAAEGRKASEVHTPADLARLLVRVLAPTSKDRVLDPCCRTGGLLISVAKYIESHGECVAEGLFSGYALSPSSASLARMNLALHGIPADVEVRPDALNDVHRWSAARRYDVVLTNPPFNMKHAAEFDGPFGHLPSNRMDFAWLQYAASSLTEQGRAAVLMPGGTTFRQGAEKFVRAAMVDHGVVEAVVSLPPKMFFSTGIAVTLWLLRRSRDQRGEVLLLDASDLGYAVNRTKVALSDEDEQRIAETIAKWRSNDGYEDERGFSASVAVEVIQAQDYVLTPARYVGSNVEVDQPRKSVHELAEHLDHLSRRAAEVDEVASRELDRILAWTR